MTACGSSTAPPPPCGVCGCISRRRVCGGTSWARTGCSNWSQRRRGRSITSWQPTSSSGKPRVVWPGLERSVGRARPGPELARHSSGKRRGDRKRQGLELAVKAGGAHGDGVPTLAGALTLRMDVSHAHIPCLNLYTLVILTQPGNSHDRADSSRLRVRKTATGLKARGLYCACA